MKMSKIPMVDLKTQYKEIKEEVNEAIQKVIDSSIFIKGPIVEEFEEALGEFVGVDHVIGCANGTDALQIALMALDLKPGDEIVVPSFTYVATAEVIALLGLTPIMVDVQLDTFEISLAGLEKRLSSKTKAIIPVHLFGQCTNMDAVMSFASRYNLFVIEDNAQSIGAVHYSKSQKKKSGSIGHISTTSFFPSKNLGCYGDGGAIFTNKPDLAEKIRMICCHGENTKYHHRYIGVNSRLDAIQAAVLNVKLKRLDKYNDNRNNAAKLYDNNLKEHKDIICPFRAKYSSHVFHQYTLRITNGKRDELRKFLAENGIPTGIYYPIPLYKQEAYKHYVNDNYSLENTETLCKEVISLPMHSELNQKTIDYITTKVLDFLNA